MTRTSDLPDPAQGDQSGDRLPDFFVDDTLYAGPLHWDDVTDAYVGDQVVKEAIPDEWHLITDLTGDGIRDWYVDEPPIPDAPEYRPYFQYAVMSGGPTGTHTTGTALARFVFEIADERPLECSRIGANGVREWAFYSSRDESIRFAPAGSPQPAP